MLETIKILLGIKDGSEDALISLYIEQCKQEIQVYTQKDFSPSMELVCAQMAVEKYRKRYNEGITSTSQSGVGISFKDGYSKEIMDQLNSFKKKVRFL